MEVSNKLLKNVSFLYIIIPVMCFILGWLRYYIAIPVYLACGIIIYLFFKNNQKDKGSFFISKKVLIFIIIFAFVYIFFSGIGELVYQPPWFIDYKVRNAIFRDLIFKPWPVKYSSTNYLCYYFCQWLVPAIIGKGLTCIINNSEIVLLISNIILYLYSLFGMILIFLWILKIFKKVKSKTMILILISFILFSGLDIIGSFIINKGFVKDELINGFECFLFNFNVLWQYSSFNTFICWCHNQAFVSILIALILIDDFDYKNQILLLVLGLFYAPFQLFGLGLYLFTLNIIKSIKNKNINIFKQYISVKNILSICFILPIIFLYYMSNYKVIMHMNDDAKSPFHLGIYILFIFTEFLLYVLLIYRKNNKDNLNIAIITIFLAIIPIIGTLNFILKVSILLILILWVYIIRFLIDKNSSTIRKKILITFLIIASLGPIIEIKSKIYNTIKQGHLGSEIPKFDIMDLETDLRNQYISTNKDTFFFKYLSRDN